jgi:two-component system, OmpR family, alkaline phosphatase synthesis response regulator PhoP
MKLLLIEDDPDIQLVARAALKRAGFEVHVAGNGAAALEAAHADPPSVILLDWMMPDMEGPDVCQRLKADPATRHIPVIFMTARSQQSEVERGLSVGAAGYIVKPFDALQLGQQVRALLQRP